MRFCKEDTAFHAAKIGVSEQSSMIGIIGQKGHNGLYVSKIYKAMVGFCVIFHMDCGA